MEKRFWADGYSGRFQRVCKEKMGLAKGIPYLGSAAGTEQREPVGNLGLFRTDTPEIVYGWGGDVHPQEQLERS